MVKVVMEKKRGKRDEEENKEDSKQERVLPISRAEKSVVNSLFWETKQTMRVIPGHTHFIATAFIS